MVDSSIHLTVLLGVLVIISDLYARRVPNMWLLATLALGACMLVLTWLQGAGDPPWQAPLGLLIGLLAMLPFYVLGWMGAGDVKFFAVLGFLLGGKALLPIWVVASLLGGAHAALQLLWRNRPGIGMQLPRLRQAGTRVWRRVLAARQGRQGLPMAAYMGVGALTTVALPQLAHW